MPPAMSSRKIEKAARALQAFAEDSSALALVLGSGFVPLLRDFQIEKEIEFDRIPGFPPIKVPGHRGKLVLARSGPASFLILCGRAHYYEGHSMDTVAFPVHVLARLGVRDLLLTNAAGGLNPRFHAGDLMLVTDHINFMGANPLRGCEFTSGQDERFVDLRQLYDPALRQSLQKAARQKSITLRKGIYLAVSGPSYETPAEIQIFRRWGADAVGMSTVPEAIAGRACGLRVAALSCITNPAAGLSQRSGPLTHDEVLAVGRRSCRQASRLIRQFIEDYARDFPNKPGGRSA